PSASESRRPTAMQCLLATARQTRRWRGAIAEDCLPAVSACQLPYVTIRVEGGKPRRRLVPANTGTVSAPALPSLRQFSTCSYSLTLAQVTSVGVALTPSSPAAEQPAAPD